MLHCTHAPEFTVSLSVSWTWSSSAGSSASDPRWWSRLFTDALRLREVSWPCGSSTLQLETWK